jgi:hypothetical protein
MVLAIMKKVTVFGLRWEKIPLWTVLGADK